MTISKINIISLIKSEYMLNKKQIIKNLVVAAVCVTIFLFYTALVAKNSVSLINLGIMTIIPFIIWVYHQTAALSSYSDRRTINRNYLLPASLGDKYFAKILTYSIIPLIAWLVSYIVLGLILKILFPLLAGVEVLMVPDSSAFYIFNNETILESIIELFAMHSLAIFCSIKYDKGRFSKFILNSIGFIIAKACATLIIFYCVSPEFRAMVGDFANFKETMNVISDSSSFNIESSIISEDAVEKLEVVKNISANILNLIIAVGLYVYGYKIFSKKQL